MSGGGTLPMQVSVVPEPSQFLAGLCILGLVALGRTVRACANPASVHDGRACCSDHPSSQSTGMVQPKSKRTSVLLVVCLSLWLRLHYFQDREIQPQRTPRAQRNQKERLKRAGCQILLLTLALRLCVLCVLGGLLPSLWNSAFEIARADLATSHSLCSVGLCRSEESSSRRSPLRRHRRSS